MRGLKYTSTVQERLRQRYLNVQLLLSTSNVCSKNHNVFPAWLVVKMRKIENTFMYELQKEGSDTSS